MVVRAKLKKVCLGGVEVAAWPEVRSGGEAHSGRGVLQVIEAGPGSEAQGVV